MPTAIEPKLDHYPPLKEWLINHRAKCVWMVNHGSGADEKLIEGWVINGHIVVVLLYANKRGWDIATTFDGIDIIATLEDAERRVGLRS